MAVNYGRQGYREACKDDVLYFCKDTKPRGGNKLINRLKEHENELAPDCKAMMEKRKRPK